MQIRENISLKSYTSFAIDATARRFASFQTVDELQELLPQVSQGALKPPLILGGGSNLLLTKDVDGWVLKNEIKSLELMQEDDLHYYLKVGAGENWHQTVMHCVANGYAGMENLSLIPGNTGASPMQNIGAYGVEIKDIFYELEAYHIGDKAVVKFNLKDCEFGYRESVFKHKLKGQFVITAVTFRLDKTPTYHTSYGAIEQELEQMGRPELSIGAVSQAVINIRSSKLPNPAEIGNAGSFFKNPKVDKAHADQLQAAYPSMPSFPAEDGRVKIPAGWLIEQCGWKGYRKGDAGCYTKQALVLVNYGGATGKEIYDLSEEILQSVQERFGIGLEREVNII